MLISSFRTRFKSEFITSGNAFSHERASKRKRKKERVAAARAAKRVQRVDSDQNSSSQPRETYAESCTHEMPNEDDSVTKDELNQSGQHHVQLNLPTCATEVDETAGGTGSASNGTEEELEAKG